MSWDDYKNMVKNKEVAGASWKSDYSNLMETFDLLEKLKIAPPPKEIVFSNLRTMVKYVRKAIKANDLEEINNILTKASTQTNRDFRLWLGSARLEEIHVKKIAGSKKYQLTVTFDQLDKIMSKNKVNFEFIFEDGEKQHPIEKE